MSKTPVNTQRTRCENWTRAMGYIRPVANFNVGKKSEYNERVYFSENKALATPSQCEFLKDSIAA